MVSSERVEEPEVRGFGICLASLNAVLEDSDASVRIKVIVRILAQETYERSCHFHNSQCLIILVNSKKVNKITEQKPYTWILYCSMLLGENFMCIRESNRQSIRTEDNIIAFNQMTHFGIMLMFEQLKEHDQPLLHYTLCLFSMLVVTPST